MIIISDYDGTIKRFYSHPNIIEKIDLKKDIKAINKFVESGNDFVISTYRKTKSIKREIEKYKILYTYLTTYNGLVTLDNNDNVIDSKYLSRDMINNAIDILNSLQNLNFDISFKFYDEFEKTTNIDKIVLIEIKTNNYIKVLETLKKSGLNPHLHNGKIWISEESDKSYAVDTLLKHIDKKYEKDKIITVGDSLADHKMILDYNGYYMNKGELSEYRLTLNSTQNIRKLIKTLNKR